MIKVEIFTKEGCHLCDEVKAVVDKVRRTGRYSLRVEEVDITTDPALYDRFKEEIPVVFVNGKKAFKYRVTEAALKKRLGKEIS